MPSSAKLYLGDGVYVEHDGYAYVLTTENGLAVTNTIVLEPQIMAALAAYADVVKQRALEFLDKVGR